MMNEKMQALEGWSSIPLLKELHILTRDGQLNQDSRRKLKQVQHLIQLISPHLDGLESFVDLGAGKSYLGFLLYDRWLRDHPGTQLWAVERRPELIRRCKEIAMASKFDRINFVESGISELVEDQKRDEVFGGRSIDVVMALHACDTATDEALALGVRARAKVIALVPCCQAEVAKLLGDLPNAPEAMRSLWAHPLHRREFGSILTNVIRSLVLEASGYKVRVTELVGWEHSMKNELIIAEKIQLSNPPARRKLDRLLDELALHKAPCKMNLFSLLEQEA